MYPKSFQMCLINSTQGGQCYQGVQAVKRTYIECRCTHSGQAEVEAIIYRGHTDKWEGVYMRRWRRGVGMITSLGTTEVLEDTAFTQLVHR